jgi:two-component sensor histidine kinase
VTEHLDLQARFRQRQRLDLVGMAAAGIVHDTNNLLTVVQAIATRSMRRLDQPDFIADHFRQLMDTSEQIAELLRRLLEFSRPQDEQRSFIDVNEMVPTDRKLYERLLGSRIELSLDLDAKIPLVLIDRLHLTQMLLNLLVNARDALPSEGGIIRLVARFQPYSERILLQVIDNGSGIPTESMDRLFEPFFTTKGEGGTGLGLSTVRTLARQHGGDVQVDSGSSGTTFSIFLPACGQVPAADDPTDDLINLRGLGEVVLVATTDRHYGEQISDMLLFQGYRVRLAISASAAHSIASDLGLDPDEGVGLSADSLVGSVAPEAMLLLGASGQLPRRFRLVDLCDQLSMLISRR